MDFTLSPDDIIHTLTQQRNAALDEIVRMSAIVKALQRRVKELEIPATPPVYNVETSSGDLQ